MVAPNPPQPHFPSPYARPSIAPSVARAVVTQDGARIAAFVYGALHTGTPVLMLHGNGEEHGIFGPIVDVVNSAGRTVIALDSRAQGKSTRGTARLTYELMARDAIDVLDALGVARVHVLGFSDGGIEALLLGRDYPERIASITALGANLTPEGVIEEPDWDLDGAIATNQEWARHWTDCKNPQGTTHADVDCELLFATPEEAAQTAELLQLMLDEPHIEASSLSGISCPTTIMVGEHDCIRPSETKAIVDAIPSARLLVVPGVGHSLPKLVPDTVSCQLLVNLLLTERD